DAHGLIDNWLRHVQDVARAHEVQLNAISDFDRRVDRLCELNVIDQVRNVARTTIVHDAWRRGHQVQLHGWVYGLKDGLITDLGINLQSTVNS
ncbi:MAG TPA: carbonic anhydrase, partial [Vicinamibacterales bacterium]|nr:carbonic anhydrase [Vicinamibacterales bacterium]